MIQIQNLLFLYSSFHVQNNSSNHTIYYTMEMFIVYDTKLVRDHTEHLFLLISISFRLRITPVPQVLLQSWQTSIVISTQNTIAVQVAVIIRNGDTTTVQIPFRVFRMQEIGFLIVALEYQQVQIHSLSKISVCNFYSSL